ncbi:MAG: multicopper oxidase domain-containing protein [Methylococcales symbiont of Iophon sp. n. MRB-2018]|nr:MAG: multicopper oxidase domain-containing protein [Methylococcales symbiont of Iophon sp. n. MRB-2018]KAF3978926.1 MAG: multicopper oxidase domain-containing protein [Methylococcales symbiont of Iophon sp. n. MRB-2018]
MRRHPLNIILGVASLMVSMTVSAAVELPSSIKVDKGEVEIICRSMEAEWRKAQTIDGVKIQESLRCNPDNPAQIVAEVKGTNNISMEALMNTYYAADAIIKKNDIDGDGDPDLIIIKLEVAELNGHSPDFPGLVPTFDMAPGIQPGMWVFAPKSRGMATNSFVGTDANPLLRAPSPAIRVEQGDTLWIHLENTHYFPHTIHLHGVDHPFVDNKGEGNDGVPQASDKFVLPGQSRTYEIKPRIPGTFVYHCHVQAHVHVAMGLIGMLIVEENRPNNWVQTLNVGNGQVRHPSKAILEEYDSEYDMQYHAMDKELNNIIQKHNDPRLIAKAMNREYDITDSTEDYHTLNGRSFPYTLRESMIVAEPNKTIKIRMFNSSSEMMAVHTHGHKATITHYDGVEQNPIAQIMRDTYDISPAQRNDLKISTVDDGLHSYGEGIWIFHDHMEKGITTDGMNPGGNVSALAYKKYLNKVGMPKTIGESVEALFTKKFHQRKLPVWQDIEGWDLGEIDARGYKPPDAAIPMVVEAGPKPFKALSEENQNTGNGIFINLILGLLIGIVLYLLYLNREQLLVTTKARIAQFKKGDK